MNERSKCSGLSGAVLLAVEQLKSGRAFKHSAVTATGAAMFSFLLMPAPAFGQDETAEGELAEEVVVTGSRIRRQDFVANSPITTVGEAVFDETSTIGVETVLNQLPQFVPAVTQFSTTDVQNTAANTVGASQVSLRGLGSNRNLVLINGRGQPVNAALVVDTNSIPSSMIERVEVISGGASAVYGADAIGGVVNFILKDNFEGASIEARYGMTEDGYNEEYTISGLFGADVAGGRGNVMLGVEYANRDKLQIADVDWQVDEMNNPNIAGTGLFPTQTYFQPVMSGNLPSQGAIDRVFPELPPGTIRGLGAGSRYLVINPTPDGTGTVFTGAGGFASSDTIPGSYKFNGPLEDPAFPGVAFHKRQANGLIGKNTVDQWVSIPLERYSFSAKGSYNFSDSISGAVEARFSKNKNNTFLGYASSAVGGNAAFIPYGDDDIYLDSLANRDAYLGTDADGNPKFDEALLAVTPTDQAFRPGGAYGLNCGPIGGCSESDVFPMPQEVRDLMNSRPNPNDDILLNRGLDLGCLPHTWRDRHLG